VAWCFREEGEQTKDRQGALAGRGSPVANHSCGKSRLDLGPMCRKWLTMNVGFVGLSPVRPWSQIHGTGWSKSPNAAWPRWEDDRCSASRGVTVAADESRGGLLSRVRWHTERRPSSLARRTLLGLGWGDIVGSL
jgi:hypothetical protein